MSRRVMGRLLATVAAFAVVGAACSSKSETTASRPSAAAKPSAAVSLSSGGPALVQTLTDQLDGHVYLASIAVVEGLVNGLDSGEFMAAAEALDQNSQDLAASITSVYGEEGGEQFLDLWRKHIGFFVDYTAGKATKDQAKADKALQALENYKQDFSAFLDSATGGKLPSDAAAGALQMHVDSLIEAIDAAVAGDPSVFAKVYTAATEHMPETASALAGAISQQFPDKFPLS